MDTEVFLYRTLFKPSIQNVTAALLSNPNRTHVPEIAVIWAMFWAEADAPTRAALRGLVAAGRLEFAGGGWTQPDEAVTRIEDLTDAVTLGHMFLSSSLGHAPVRVGWSADPFGALPAPPLSSSAARTAPSAITRLSHNLCPPPPLAPSPKATATPRRTSRPRTRTTHTYWGAPCPRTTPSTTWRA